MKLTWLGQAGYLLESDAGTRIMIDPYLSDRLHELNGEDFRREVPIREEYLDMQLDALVLTMTEATEHARMYSIYMYINRQVARQIEIDIKP